MSFTYRGLKAELDRHIVTGEEIDRQMERLRQQNPRRLLRRCPVPRRHR